MTIKLPTYNSGGVNLGNAGPKATPDAFGAGVAEAGINIGKAAGQLAGAGAKAWSDIQEEEDHAAATAALTDAYAAQQSRLYDAKDGLLHRKGNNAAGLSEEYGKFTKEQRDGYSSRLRNDRQRRLFAERYDHMAAASLSGVASHESDQMDKVYSDNISAQLGTLQDRAGLAWRNPDELRATLQQADDAISRLAARNGQTPEIARQSLGKFYDAAAGNAFQSAIAAGDYAAAKTIRNTASGQLAYPDRTPHRMDPATLKKMDDMLEATRTKSVLTDGFSAELAANGGDPQKAAESLAKKNPELETEIMSKASSLASSRAALDARNDAIRMESAQKEILSLGGSNLLDPDNAATASAYIRLHYGNDPVMADRLAKWKDTEMARQTDAAALENKMRMAGYGERLINGRTPEAAMNILSGILNDNPKDYHDAAKLAAEIYPTIRPDTGITDKATTTGGSAGPTPGIVKVIPENPLAFVQKREALTTAIDSGKYADEKTAAGKIITGRNKLLSEIMESPEMKQHPEEALKIMEYFDKKPTGNATFTSFKQSASRFAEAYAATGSDSAKKIDPYKEAQFYNDKYHQFQSRYPDPKDQADLDKQNRFLIDAASKDIVFDAGKKDLAAAEPKISKNYIDSVHTLANTAIPEKAIQSLAKASDYTGRAHLSDQDIRNIADIYATAQPQPESLQIVADAESLADNGKIRNRWFARTFAIDIDPILARMETLKASDQKAADDAQIKIADKKRAAAQAAEELKANSGPGRSLYDTEIDPLNAGE